MMQKVYTIFFVSYFFVFIGTDFLYAQAFNNKALLEFARNELQKKKASTFMIPLVYEPANLEAAQSVNNDQIWGEGIAGLSLSGNGIVMGYWDADQPRLSHQEYSGRVTFEDSESGTNNAHATQMVGTMIATGADPDARGMANTAMVESWNWNSDIAEMAIEAANGLLTSAHPYIETAGWTANTNICDPDSDHPEVDWMWFSLESEDSTKAYQFGYYDSQAQKWDSVAYLAPDYLIVKAAGNQRGEGPDAQPISHWTYDSDFNCIQDSTNIIRELDGGFTGFESLNAASLAKNVLVVGAVESSSDNFDNINSVSPISTSGFGPTDDGRIKPDIVAPTNVYTSTSSSNNSYATGGGTSAATAVVTGSIALLREHYQKLNSDTLSSASIKALLAQTADDIGNEGPDYKTGWGLLNTERAARFISSNKANMFKSVLKDTVLTNGNTIQFDFEHTSDRPLIITIAWTDPSGTPSVNADDPVDTLLVNDLDLLVTKSATNYHPWILDKSNPNGAASTGDNDLDNIEQVLISNAESGTYSISISHEGMLQSGSQRVSVLIGEAEPEIEFETIANGNWKEASTWSAGIAPSTSLHRAVLKHSVMLDTSVVIRGVTFDGTSAELVLNGKSLNLYGGVFYFSGAVGFLGDTSSSLNIFDWDSGSDSIRFRSGFQKLDSLRISLEGDSVKLGSDISVYSKLSLESGILDASSVTLKLISDTSKTAILKKSSGNLLGNLTYSRLYSEESSGWRIFSSPVQSEMFSTLSDSFHTQGGAWANYSVSENESSLWLFNSSAQTFEGQTGEDSSFTSGEGYLFYMFNDISGGNLLPSFLEFTGVEPDSVIRDLYRGTHDSLSYNLVGNPFAGTLDWHEIVNDGTNLGTSYAVWDPSGNTGGGVDGFKYYNASTQLGDAGRYIAPMQGFFAQATAENATMAFRQDQKTGSSPNKYGKVNSAGVPFLNVKLYSDEQVLLDDQAYLSFSENSNAGVDAADMLRMRSLNGRSNQVIFLGKESQRRVFEGRSSLVESDEIEIVVQTTETGKFTLNWKSANQIPQDWKLELVDLLSGSKVDMGYHSEYSFWNKEHIQNKKPRFRVLIQRKRSVDSETENPIRYTLSQNYPNPFNPTTTVSFSIEKAGNVNIEVFNTLGQKVAVLVNEQKSAGSHSVQFNASQFSSGVYYYRIEADGFNQIRSMVFIK